MRRSFAASAAIVAALCAAAAVFIFEAGPARGEAAEAARGTIVLSVGEGKAWNHSFRKVLFAKVTNQPQMAFWLEDTSGAYVATIYVTHRTAVQDWRASFGEKRERIERPSSLPVWSLKHAERGVEPKSLCGACHGLHKQRIKTSDNPALHAMTGATPKSGFTHEWKLPAGIEPGRYVVRAEINHSKDFNETYPARAKEGERGYSGGAEGSGQPSIVWEGVIAIGDAPASARLERVGHGEPSGASGEMFRDLGSLTTALDIVESIRVEFRPAK